MSKTELLTPAEISEIEEAAADALNTPTMRPPSQGRLLQIVSQVPKLLGHIQALTEHRRWIPCSERMPEMNVEVLWADALHPGEYVAAFRPQSGAVPSMYTHWQPIIPAPQEEGKPNE